MVKTTEYTKLILIALGLLALFLLLSLLLRSAVQILLLIFAGILFSIFIRGLSNFLFGKFNHLSENWSIAITLMLLVIAFIAFFILLAPQLAEQGGKLVEQIPEAFNNLRERINHLDWLENLFQSFGGSSALSSAGTVSSQALGFFATTIGIITSMFIILFVGLYLSFTPQYYINGIIRLVPQNGRQRTGQVFSALDYTLGLWLIGRFTGMLVVSVSTFIGLYFLKVPLPLSLAVLAGLLTFIPNIGPILSAIPAILLGYTESPSTALYVILLYLLIQGIESYIITPLIQQRAVAMPPVLTLTSQVVLGTALGFLGLLLATPLTAAAMVLVKMLYIEDVLGEKCETDGIEE
ncbi:AI-2E family transporter [Desulfopila inferna]|uniref:AI-2E family transporter n=1 Tax=Desulfopila inferna TaxID=468528 RepID=UPI0019645701|nr:AI-2E family transporter [Desulfopila inferna]MBM9605329.1 AI-2E family transporter [Desulfopila inferna]